MLLLPLFILLSGGLTVILIGMCALAWSKREGLGKIYKIISYAAITCGTIVCVGGILIVTVFSCLHATGCGGNDNDHRCYRMYKGYSHHGCDDSGHACSGDRCHSQKQGCASYGHGCDGDDGCSKKKMKMKCEMQGSCPSEVKMDNSIRDTGAME